MNRRLFIAALLTMSMAACTKKNSGKLDYGLDVADTLRVNLQTEPPDLDWTRSSDTTSATVEMNMMDGLVDYSLTDPELPLVPSLATEWKPSENGRVWTFKLREGVKWTDGVPFTAQNVIDGLERVLNPKTASEYAYFLFNLKNGRAYSTGKVKDFKEVGARVSAKGEVVIELEQPMGYLPMLFAHHATFPIRKDVIEKWGDKWTDPSHIQTLGPYKLKVWEHDKSMVLERFDDYWGEKAKIKNVLIYMINEFSTALNLVDSGKLDFQQELPAKELPIWSKKPGFRQTGSLSSYYYGFNTRKPPFNDVRVRRAFVHAVDRKQITDLLAAGHAPLTGWIPAGMFGYENERGLKYDPEAAAKILDEAGFKDRSKFPRVTLAFNTNENHQRIAENVQAQIKKNLGIEVQISNEEWKTYLSRVRTDPPNIYRMGWLADYPDPSTFVNLVTSFSENNYTGWGSKKYDELASEGSRTLDKDKRKAIYSELQKILTEEEAPVLPIYTGVRQLMLSTRIKDFPLTPLERYAFRGVTFK